nr:flagellar hook-associated protein FlgK [Gammaproteobacteria bacterium]
MGLSGLIGQGLSGLVASQRGLATSGHNISNANTPGYHRQRVELAARPPSGSDNGFTGNGVAVNAIRRSYDQFLTAQIRTSTAGTGEAQTFHALASRVDNVLANSDTGLASALQSFFDAVHEVAADPSSLANRQVLLTQAEGLAQRYHALDRQLTDLEQEANGRLTGLVSEVNALAEGIAEVNREIVQAEGAAGGAPANDLRDRRDELLRQLAEQIGFHTVEQDDGAINVLIGKGHPLVVGGSNMSLSVVANPFDATRKELAVAAGGSSITVSHTLSGGAIGGILDFRDRVLTEAENALGRVAVGLAQNFNSLHRSGADRDGNPGLDFFVSIDSVTARVLGHDQNTGTSPSVTITDPAALTTSDYRLDYDGTEYVVTRLSDNNVERFSAPAGSLGVDGFEIDVSVPLSAGDRFMVRPVAAGARKFGLLIQEPRRIAAALPDALGGVGDNRNALQLAHLQQDLALENGSATLAGAYGQLVASVGAITQKAEAQRSAQEVLLNQVTDARDAVSGVNLDEEAANLLRYQQAYEASARFIAAADATFNSLLDVVGR